MIWKLLRQNVSARQLAGYAVATLAGLVIVMVAVKFYADLSPALSGNAATGEPRNIIISKPVGLGNTLSGSAPAFSDAEMREIAAQSWCDSVVAFTAADFGVWAAVDMGGRSMSTALFFESVPDAMAGVDPSLWRFDPDHPVIPIMISRDYLALYNFGFAAGGRMPVVSEKIIRNIPLQITVSGPGGYTVLPGRIVGFSSWLNTIAVPQAFMDWAHNRFGTGSAPQPSRLIVVVGNPGNPAVDAFMADHGYEIAGAPDTGGRAAFFLRLIASAVGAVGSVIVILALGILVLGINLLITRNRATIGGLLLLGYTPRRVSRGYIIMVCAVNGAVFVLAAATALLLSSLWHPALEALGADPSAVWIPLAAGLALTLAITAMNCITIRRRVTACFRD